MSLTETSWEHDEDHNESADQRSVLSRASKILDAFSASDSYLPLAEIARRACLPKTTTHRLTAEMAEIGMLERGRYGFRVGLRMFELGHLAPRARSLRERARPWLESLHGSTTMTVNLAVRDGLDVVYIDILNPLRWTPLPSRVGARLPAHSSGIGKVILAYSDEDVAEAVLTRGLQQFTENTIRSDGRLEKELVATRSEGVAYDNQETVRGVVCLAAPILAADGSLLAAISVTTASTSRRAFSTVEHLVRDTAESMSAIQLTSVRAKR